MFYNQKILNYKFFQKHIFYVNNESPFKNNHYY